MAPRLLRFVLTLLAIIGLALPTSTTRAAGAPLPTLDAFASDLITGDAAELVGVYAPDLFAHRVVQQPPGEPGFVSDLADVLTQYGKASELGSTGILAHNYLAGSRFASLSTGQVIHLVYGNGRTVTYVISEVARFKALQPNSAFSAFEDLQEDSRVGASELFSRMYGRPGVLVFQTCIKAEGNLSWGRLFVAALPISRSRTLRAACRDCQ
jgi:hypothetical protein